ncbi:Zinc finger, DPH-type [Trema orientale]|uniref:Zinc finger, DPH-type n=1 Tax=Trema orientale TaxID=63057 RepID=A0A2P5E8Y4_TREOI|nr:Zinc finger, DPH-type [Trema orientale]
MMVEDGGDMIELFYQCRCGDYFSLDSLELGKLGYPLLRDGSKISLLTGDALPASVVLPCGSCSLKVRFLINSDIYVTVDDDMRVGLMQNLQGDFINLMQTQNC